MATVTYIQPYGNQLKVLFDDGTSALAYPTSGSLWIVSMTNGGGGPPGPGTGTVIYPTPVHTVSDSFDDHVRRGSANPGTDYEDPTGDPVWAVADGIVTDYSNTNTGDAGHYVHIDHTALNMSTDYLHLDHGLVSMNQHVVQGQQIAVSDNTGSSTGSHMHISIRNVLGYSLQDHGNFDFDAYIKSLPGGP